MNDGFHALDIVFFAAVAVFLILRLRNVLGRRTGAERPPPDWTTGAPPPPVRESAGDNVIDLSQARKPNGDAPAVGPVGRGEAAIRAYDPTFTTEGFLDGARMAFEMIVAAYAAGDKKALRPLLADAVHASFCQAIDARARAGEELSTELMGIRSAAVTEATMVGPVARVTVRFLSEQINVLRSLDGRVIEGDPSRIAESVDEWTFSRDTRARDPNWQLAATRAQRDEPDVTGGDA